MITYADFQLSESDLECIKGVVARQKIRKYIKDNSVEPSDVSSYSYLTEDEINEYRRIFYARYLLTCNMESETFTFSNGHTRLTAIAGDTVYFNGTPIGVVVISVDECGDGLGRMMSLPAMSPTTPHTGCYNTYLPNGSGRVERSLQWGLYQTCVSDLTHLTTEESKLDYNGKENTAKIIALHTIDDLSTCETISNGNDTNSAPAAACCYCFSTPGTQMGDWYLPAAGEWYKIIEHRQAINYGIADLNEGLALDGTCDLVAIPLGDNSHTTGDTRNNWGNNWGQWYWSSNESPTHTIFYINTYDLSVGLNSRPRNTANGWGCTRAFCHF